MSGRRGTTLLCLVLAGLLAMGGTADATVVFVNERLSSDFAISGNPETDGEWVVWDNRVILPGTTYDIVAENLASGEATSFGGAGDQRSPDISLERVVYEHHGANSDIRLRDLRTGEDVPIATSADNEILPRISGDLVVWQNSNSGALWYKNLRTGATEAFAGPDNYASYDVDRGRIVWIQGGPSVYIYEPGVDAAPRTLLHAGGDFEYLHVRVHGDTVAASQMDASDGDNEVRVMNLKNGAGVVVDAYGGQEKAVVFHNSVAWEQHAVISQDVQWEEHPSANAAGAVNVATSDVNEVDLSMFGRRVAWAQPTDSGDIYIASAAPEAHRTQGADRYATAAAASSEYFGKANNAVLCTGKNFPDALTAAPLARIVGGPLLLARFDTIPQVTMDELTRLGVTNVFIIGGESALSPAIATALTAKGITSERISGATRYDTANAIAARIVDAGNSTGVYDGTAFFARGDTFPDALAVGPVAAGAGAPIFLVKPNELPPSVGAAIATLNVSRGFVIGGEPAVGTAVEAAINDLLTENGGGSAPTKRWFGADRYATAGKVLAGGLGQRYIDLDTLGLATGENFPDALGGGAALGYYGSGIALTKGSSLPDGLVALLDSREYEIGRLDVFGGTSVVSDIVMTGVAARLK